MDQFLERLTHAVASTWWLSSLLQTLTALVYTRTCASKQPLFWCSIRTAENYTSPGVSPCTCPAKLYDTRLNMCVLVCMLDLLFCSTIADFTFTSWFLCRHRGNGEIFPSNVESSDITCSQLLHPMEKPSALRGKASFFFPQKHTHFINEFSWLTKC